MLAQCGTAGFLFGAGDIIAQQTFEKKGKDHDVSIACEVYNLLLVDLILIVLFRGIFC
jgi:hypothetical protein